MTKIFASRSQFVAIFLCQVGLMALSGCAYRLQVTNKPLQQRLRLAVQSPEYYQVRVAASGNSGAREVSSDGRVTIDIPSLPRGCDVYLFGWIRIAKAESAFDHKVVHIVHASHVVRRLSLNEMEKLEADSEGYRVVKVSN